jgi:hypothetical protein
MAAAITVGQIFQLVASYNNSVTGTGVYINRGFWRMGSILAGPITETDVATAWGGAWIGEWRALSNNQYGIISVACQTWSGGVRTAGYSYMGGIGPGSRAGNGVPPTTSWNIKKKTDFAGRAYRGRVYVPGLSAADTNGGETAAAFQADQTFGISKELWTAPQSLTNVTVAWTQIPIIATAAGAGVPVERAPITSGEYDNTLRVQRRRENHHGS